MKTLRFFLALSAVLLLSPVAQAQCPVITVSPATLANATAGQAYGPVAFSASPAGSYTFEATGAPTGLTMSAGGSLSGTPTQTGTFAVRAVATDAGSCVATHILPLTVSCPTITVTPATMPNGLVGVAYPSQTLVGSGGTGPYTFAVTSGSLPPGLTLVGNTVSGTPTTMVGSPFGFTITATDANNCTGAQPYTVTIGTCPTITVTNPAVVNGTSGSPYTTAAFTQSGATTPSFTIASGSLPTGLSLGAGTGVISGTPTQTGTFSVTVRATETTGANTGCFGDGGTYTFQICPTITVTNPPVVDGTNGSPYTTAAFTQTGATTPSFTIASGSLPTGLNLNAVSGIISGTPTQTGSFTVTVRATETVGGTTGCFGTGGSYTFKICPVITVTNPSRVDGVSGTVYAGATFTQTGVTTPSFTIASGSLPTGLTLNAGTGAVTGTPTQTGTFTITVRVTETAAGGTNGCFNDGASYTFQICPQITIARTGGGSFPDPLYQQSYTGQSFTASGGTGPYTFAVTVGSLPTGLSLASNGTLSGTPTTTGAFPFTVTATSSGGSPVCAGSQAFTFTARPNTVGDTYLNGVGNTQYVIAGYTPFPGTPAVSNAATVIANDVYPGSPTPSNLVVSGAPTHGVVTLKTDGTFLYTPNVGDATGSDAFTYTLTDTNGITNTAAVAVNWSGMVWYVNHGNAAATHDGRSHAPFLDFGAGLGNFGSATTQTGNTIFVHTGSATTTGTVTLLATQRLWGNGVAFALNGLSIAAGTKPTMSGTATLANGVTVTGITFNPSGAISALTGSALTGTVTIDQNTIAANNAATAVNLQTGTASVNFTATSIAQSGAGTGLVVNGKTGGTVSFDATSPISVTGAGATGINLTGNGGATINFAGTLTLTTTTGPAFVATGGGTVSATDTNSTLTTTTGIALNVTDTIGAGNLKFKSITAGTAASGPSSGIILSGTGNSGGLIVSGTGSAGSGGTIQKTTGSGISLTSVGGSASFTDMNISSTASDGVTANTVNNFSCSLCNITNPGSAANKQGLNLNELSGTASLTNVTVTGATQNGAFIQNTSATLTSLTISGGSYSSTNNAFASAGSGLEVIAKTTGVITTATVSGVTFNANFSSAIQSFAQDTASIGDNTLSANGITVSGCTFTNNGAAAADFDAGTGTGTMKFRFLNNLTITGNVGPTVNVFSSATATGGLIQGRIDGNVIGTNAVTDSGSTGGAGIRVFLQGVAGNITIVNNTIRSTACSRGIEVQTLGPVPANGGVRTSDIVITGNNVNNFSSDCAFPLNDIYLTSDNQAGGAGTTLRADVKSNTIKTAGATPANTDFPFDNLEWLYFDHTAGTAQLVGSGANANAVIAASQTSGSAKANAAVSLIAGPITTVP